MGRKAALLAWADSQGVPTPGGLVLPAEEFWAALDACEAGAQARYLQQSALRLNPEQSLAVAASIVDAMRSPALDTLAGADAEAVFVALGGPPLVCRSSSAMEDGPAAAFPGIFESVLDIGSPAELAGAIAACWRSAFSPEAVGYVLRMGVEPLDFSLALLVQRQVEGPWYGVYASVDPVTGAAEPMADLSGDGPDALVAGARATLQARRRDGRWAGVDDGLATSLEAVHDAAVRLAEHLGSEVDLEFALPSAGAGPVILQCRPLTSAGGAMSTEVSGGILAGRPCARGRAAGVAGTPGGIAVVERLTPADYGVVLASAGVVTEQDASPLGHVAILCRELGVPLICGVAGARDRFSGRWLTIDGGTGMIETDSPHPSPTAEKSPPVPAEPALGTVELLLRVLAEGRPGHEPRAEAERLAAQYARALGAKQAHLVPHAGGHAGLEGLDSIGAALFGPGFSAARLLDSLDNG